MSIGFLAAATEHDPLPEANVLNSISMKISVSVTVKL